MQNAAAIQPKRLRPDEIAGMTKDDPNKSVTRLLLNKTQFSRVIGKGGQTIAHIRSATGVFMKGADIDEEWRLVLLTGTFDQVIGAFDMITEFLQQGDNATTFPAHTRNPELTQINLLLEHSKAGKAVGSKGSMMQTIKVKSGAVSIRIEKDPMDVQGVSLRKLTIEGNVGSVRRAHLLVQELYAEPTSLQMSVAYANYLNNGGTPVVDIGGLPSGRPGAFPGAPTSFEPPMAQAGAVDPSTGTHMVPVPFPSLVNFGVQAETVRQLTEMKAYLWRHFGLDLNISREVIAAPGMHAGAGRGIPDGAGMGPGGYPSAGGVHPGMASGPNLSRPPMGNPRDGLNASNGTSVAPRPSIESVIEQRRANNPQEVCFSVPKAVVGALIGKGGQHLRDLSTEFGVRVYIEKEDFNGKRLVVLSFAGNLAEATETDSSSAAAAVQRCKDHIERMIEEQLKQKAAGNDINSGMENVTD